MVSAASNMLTYSRDTVALDMLVYDYKDPEV